MFINLSFVNIPLTLMQNVDVLDRTTNTLMNVLCLETYLYRVRIPGLS